MKVAKIVLIVLAVLMVLGLGAGTTFFILAGRDGAGEGEERAGEIVDLGEYVVNVQHQRSMRVVRTQISVEADPDADLDVFENKRVQIRDAVIKVLRGMGEEAIEDPQAARLRQEIIRELNEVTAQELIRSLYFTEFVVQ